MDEIKQILKSAEKFKYPLLILFIGVILMLTPSMRSEPQSAPSDETRLAQALSRTSGVGEASVLISESGVVVVCKGAGTAAVRLDIIRAVRSYTGFSSDKITILQLAG